MHNVHYYSLDSLLFASMRNENNTELRKTNFESKYFKMKGEKLFICACLLSGSDWFKVQFSLSSLSFVYRKLQIKITDSLPCSVSRVKREIESQIYLKALLYDARNFSNFLSNFPMYWYAGKIVSRFFLTWTLNMFIVLDFVRKI